ncbi:hypothetical protein [Nostoc sp.]|uniref:hypothetical protein n=1 Tax=Nostoc sp. TaxID=1180 RepID=UPI002FFA55E1
MDYTHHKHKNFSLLLIKEIKSPRRGASSTDNKSLEYFIFEFNNQIQQRRFFFIAALSIFNRTINKFGLPGAFTKIL